MAYTSIHTIRATVSAAIAYITRDDKTVNGVYVNSYACRADLSLTVWRTEMPHSTFRACGAENLPLKRKSPQKRLQSVSESLWLFSSNRGCTCCGMLHNSYSDLCGTEIECANRLWSFAKPVNKLFHILADALILEIMHIMSTVQLYELSIFRSIDHCLHTTPP